MAEPEWHSDELFSVGGEIAALMRQKDWAATPLGPPHTWPQSLRTIVRVMLTSRFAMWMGWGPDLTFFYNDAYRAMTLGAKHPWALGRPAREVWAEIWPEIGPRIERVLQTGEATWDEDLLLFLERSGFPEETYHTFSYSPVTDDSGRVAGHLCVVTEETLRVIGERRIALLRETAAGIAGTNAEAELFVALAKAIERDTRDLPFTLTYLFDHDHARARLVCHTGIAGGGAAAPASIALDGTELSWPLERAAESASGVLVEDLPARFPGIPAGAWGKPPAAAIVLPIAQQGQKRPAGVFVAGLNPFRPFEAEYQSFVALLVGQIAAGLANAHAYEEEKRRAHALAEIDRAKTIFFSNVSHEFRTPLTLMMGPLDDLLAKPPGGVLPENREVLTLIHRNGLRLLKLVNTLLDFSRIEAGRAVASYEPVDLSEYTVDLASTFRSAMEKAGLTFTVSCEPLPGAVHVDRDMWEKIVLNLLSNALKFTLHGSVSVALAARQDRAVLEVADTGAGIPDTELPKIFDRFHRVEGTHGRSHEGSGIGLALVQELVKLHGGEITVDSQSGQGTRFSVAIPFGTAHLPADRIVPSRDAAPPRSAAAYVEEALRWLAPADESSAAGDSDSDEYALLAGHVLLADDNADMRDYGRRLLSDRWTVEAVRNGKEALAAARRRRPDVIVTDVMMPEMDGFALLRALRSDEELRTVPVILLSARAGEEAKIEGLTAGADDYLVKPFSARDLVARVDAQLIRARARAIEHEHAKRLVNLFTHAPVAIAILRGPEHVYELANDHYRELVGGRDVIGLPIRRALPELEGQGIYELLDRVRTSGEPFIGRSLRITLNRGTRGEAEDAYFDFVYQPTFDESGQVDSIVVVAHDVTALARAKQEAETASRLKDEFLATLSHELRTPLNAVLGYVQMVRGGLIESDRLPTVLETIERNAKLQEQLVSDVLDVSRIITGKLRLEIRPVDLTQVIQDAIATVTPAASSKGVRLQAMVEQPGVPVAGDPQRLQQVVWNLLSNSVKFTSRGGRIQVRLARVNSHVEITVSDTGEGIAPEFLPHLFHRFTQADGSFSRRHGGLGLGLAICRHLVEAHGGQIEASSPGKGRGTTVRVALPLMAVHDATVDAEDRIHPAADTEIVRTVELADLTGLRVLVVDDDPDALQMVRDALSAAGATVFATSDADEALAMLDRETCDVAVLDIGMPNVDGYELLRRIRARGHTRQGTIPAAALTAYARAVDRTRSLRAGFQTHLTKPVQPTELTAAVAALAHARHARQLEAGAGADADADDADARTPA